MEAEAYQSQFFQHQKMRQTKDTQRRLFQHVQHFSYQLACRWISINDIVEAGEDPRMLDNTHSLIGKQAAQSMSGIDANMWGKAVAQHIGQVVDQRRIAEVVDAAPIMPML